MFLYLLEACSPWAVSCLDPPSPPSMSRQDSTCLFDCTNQLTCPCFFLRPPFREPECLDCANHFCFFFMPPVSTARAHSWRTCQLQMGFSLALAEPKPEYLNHAHKQKQETILQCLCYQNTPHDCKTGMPINPVARFGACKCRSTVINMSNTLRGGACN